MGDQVLRNSDRMLRNGGQVLRNRDRITPGTAIGSRPEQRSDPNGIRTRTSDAPPQFSFVKEAELWAITAYGRTIRIKDTRGVAMVARLVAEPHREIHLLELSGSAVVDEPFEAIDTKARHAYRTRAEELREDLAEATRLNDLGHAARLRTELEAIEDELSRSVGLGGKPRRVGHAAERARSNVQRRVSEAIERIAEVHSVLGEHLKKCVRTGTFCSYSANPL